jgi:indole-3-glycerol phosphate synthase
VQGSNVWQPPGGTLAEILEETRLRLRTPWREPSGAGGADWAARPSLTQALRRENVAVIAELKRRSPSKGSLNESLAAKPYATMVEDAGAAAISVLTEPRFFNGAMRDLWDVAAAVQLPVLKKDFHIEASQLREAVTGGASAVLLIARALSPHTLPELVTEAKRLGLDTLVEVRSDEELERALAAGAELIGVNSRDLETLEIDPTVPERLMPRIPANVVAVWESGVSTPDDVRRAADHGADAVLVGSALAKATDPATLLRSMTVIPRSPRS